MGKRGPKASGSRTSRIEAAGYLKPDRDLSPAAKKSWNQTVKAMSAGFYTAMDRSLLRIYSRLYVDFEQAQAAVEREGVVIQNQLGYWIENPWYRAMLKAAEALARLAVKLKACKSAVETHNAAAQAARIGKPGAASPRAHLMFGGTKEDPAERIN